MKYSTGAVAIGLLAVAAAAAVCQAATSRQDIFANRRKQNYVDPIYAFDDVDVVTSSAMTAGNRAQEPAKIKESPKKTSAKPGVQVVSSFVAAKRNITSEAAASRPPTPQKRSSFDDLAVIVSKNASEKPRFEPPANILVKAAVSSSDANQYSLFGDYSPGARVAQKPIEEKHHWSGLENYYKKLRAQQPTVQEVYEIQPEPYPERSRADFQYPGTHRNSGPIIVVPPNRDYVVSTPISQSPYRFPYDQTYRPLSSGHNPITSTNPRADISTTQFNDSQHTQTQIHVPTRDDRRAYPYPLVEVAPPPPPVMERRQVVVVGGREYYLDPVSDPQEAREIRRHEERIESQRQNFGPLYDDRRAREQYQEALYCHLRNKINPQRQQQQLRTDPSSGGAVAPNDGLAENYPSGGEFPSHLGIYNGTPSEDNFLCAASWVDNGYALTTASCVDGVNLKQLQVRFGEWNLNKQVPQNASAAPSTPTNNASTRITFTSAVKEVTRYYRYNKNNIFEHNLALIQLEQPINFRLLPYVSPACQPYNSRIPIRRSKICWAPVRNITLSEYFDADGEGETKEKKNVALIEMPVRMIPNDDPECIKQTRGEFVNHPDYICSGDYRTAPWRAKLNQTDYFGSGIYCDEGGFLSLTSMLHPIGKGTASSVGYLDLSYYKPWMQGVINSNSY